MPSRGQGLSLGLRPHHPQDLLQCHNTWTEGIAVVLDDVVQFADQRFGLCVVQLKVHALRMSQSAEARYGLPATN